MIYSLKDLVLFLKTGGHSFYEHLRVEDKRSEIKFDGHSWFFRQDAYSGDWKDILVIESELTLLFQKQLNDHLVFFLCTEYCFLKMIEPNPFREKQLEKFLGKDVCEKSLEETLKFQETLVSMVKNLCNKTHLKLV